MRRPDEEAWLSLWWSNGAPLDETPRSLEKAEALAYIVGVASIGQAVVVPMNDIHVFRTSIPREGVEFGGVDSALDDALAEPSAGAVREGIGHWAYTTSCARPRGGDPPFDEMVGDESSVQSPVRRRPAEFSGTRPENPVQSVRSSSQTRDRDCEARQVIAPGCAAVPVRHRRAGNLVRRIGPPPGLRPGDRAQEKRRKPRVSGAFVRADEGTRTLDLLHGKQTL